MHSSDSFGAALPARLPLLENGARQLNAEVGPRVSLPLSRQRQRAAADDKHVDKDGTPASVVRCVLKLFADRTTYSPLWYQLDVSDRIKDFRGSIPTVISLSSSIHRRP